MIVLAWLGGVLTLPAMSPPTLVVGTVWQDPTDEVEKLRALLGSPGAEGRELRERAIERLLAMPRLDAHAVLQDRLRQTDDPDGVRLAIVASLQRHFLLLPAAYFGAVGGSVRDRILAEYVRALLGQWRVPKPANGQAELRQAGRACLQRLPARELDVAARALFPEVPVEEQIDLLRCLADMQNTVFAATIADRLDVGDAAVRAAAVEALNLVLWPDTPLLTRADYVAWAAVHGHLRYVDLVERVARRGVEPMAALQAELSRLRIDAAREVVRAHVARSPGIDWASVQARVVVDNVLVLDACLEYLQQTLPGVPDDASPARTVFARALLARFRAEPAMPSLRRVRLLEVAAYLGRTDDGEFAKELVPALQAELAAADAEVRGAAMRGLRRFPSAETRAQLVALGLRLCESLPQSREQLAPIVAILGSRTAPRWPAPGPTDGDKSDWLRLIERVCRSDEPLELREQATAIAPMLDVREQRVPEAFELLCELARDVAQPPRLRSACALHLQGWRQDPALADAWLKLHHELLRDVAPELRQQAAESLATLPESTDSRRADWIAATILAVRDRLLAEPEPAVLRALVDCAQSCGREASMTEKALGALQGALAGLGQPVAAEQQFRLEPLLQALATIGADPRAERAQWLAVCQSLLEHGRRQSLRLILSNHAAADLAKDVANPDAGLAARARAAMLLLVETGLMKPPRESWGSSDELQREAREIRTAFSALDDKDRPDRIEHRLLRLEVDFAANKPQEVVARATSWLASGEGAGRAPMREEDRYRMRFLLAEAQLQLGRADAARKALEDRSGEVVDDPALRNLEHRIATALAASDLPAAVELLGQVWRRTPVEDKEFRGRLLEWAQLRLRRDPTQRDEVLREAERFAAQFEAADCPPEQRQAFLALRQGGGTR